MVKTKKLKDDSLKNGSFIQILKTFSRAEMKEFEKFLRSPFFNNRSEVINFFKLIKKYYPAFTQNELTKNRVYLKLYPGSKYKDNVIRRISSNLKNLAEQYITYKEFLNDNFETKLHLIHTLLKRNLDSLFVKESNAIKQSNKKDAGIEEQTFYNNKKLSIALIDFNLANGDKNEIIKNVFEGGNNLIYFIIIELCRELMDRQIFEWNYNIKAKEDLLNKFMIFFDSSKFITEMESYPDDNKSLALAYFYAYQAKIRSDNEDILLKLEQIIQKHSDNFTKQTTQNLYQRLLTAYSKFNTGVNNAKILEVYKFMDKKDLLTEKDAGFIQKQTFVNVVHVATKIGEFEWAEMFVSKNINKLHPKNRLNTFNYCKASISYHKKDFEKALEYNMNVSFDTVHNLSSKILSAKIHYDLGNFEQLFSLIDSFRHYLRTNKAINDNVKTVHLDYLSNLNHLAKIKSGSDHKELQIFKEKIVNANSDNYSWILEKIYELEVAVNKKGVQN